MRKGVSISNPLVRNTLTTSSSGSLASYQAAANAALCDLYQEVTCLHFLHVHARYSENLSVGVMEELQGMLLKYNPDIQGVPLLFSRVELTPAPTTQPIPAPTGYPTPVSWSMEPVQSAAIIAENPRLHIWVRVRWLAFCPSRGSRVVGSVIRQGPEQINLLLLGLFNATIKRDQLAGSLDWSEEEAAWVNSSKSKRIGLGDLLEFEVLSVRTEMNLLRIVGSLDKMQQPAPSKSKTRK